MSEHYVQFTYEGIDEIPLEVQATVYRLDGEFDCEITEACLPDGGKDVSNGMWGISKKRGDVWISVHKLLEEAAINEYCLHGD